MVSAMLEDGHVMRPNIAPLALVLTSVLAGAPVVALADRDGSFRDDSYDDWARVVDVEPIYREATVSRPREVCGDTVGPGYRSYTPSVVGGILGGVVGNQFGSGRGKDAMTVAGVLLGASVGRDAAHANAGYRSRGYSCWTERDLHHHRELDGYRVRYRYDGHHYHRVTPHHPGDRIRVQIYVQSRKHVRPRDWDHGHHHRGKGHGRYNRGHDWKRH